MNLNAFLKENNITNIEGNTGQVFKQINILKNLCSNPNIKNILEIGFNAGHSSEIFLSNNPECKVVSFDLGNHDYTILCKKFIDEKYPGRHTLILGSSNYSLKRYLTSIKFDLIFIDGGHQYEIAYNDIIDCRNFATIDTLLIMDDVVYSRKNRMNHNIGPCRAWNKAIEDKIIVEDRKLEFRRGRGMTIGKYT